VPQFSKAHESQPRRLAGTAHHAANMTVHGSRAARLKSLHCSQRLAVDALTVDLSALVNKTDGSSDLARFFYTRNAAQAAATAFQETSASLKP
jgi:hypothetical protein